MMSVMEYALDVSLSVDVILSLCNKLNIDVKNEEDMLDDDAIILLDNEIQNGDYSSDDYSDEEDIEEEISIPIVEKNKSNITKKSKTNKFSSNSKEDFMSKRKEMYKHKDKLKSNVVEINDNDVIYHDGMSVGDLANSIGVSASEVIKKLMTMGMMMNLNQAIDFDTASIIVMDYNKNIKREEVVDESNFEELEIIDNDEELLERPPVVTIMMIE